jgi:hypothetical protein
VLYLLRKGLWKPALLDEKGEYSLMCVLLLPPLPEGVIGIKPRGGTRQKKGLFYSFLGQGLSYSNPYEENY